MANSDECVLIQSTVALGQENACRTGPPSLTNSKDVSKIRTFDDDDDDEDEDDCEQEADGPDLASKVRRGPKKHWKPKRSGRLAPTKTWWKFIFRLLFSHLGLFLLVCGYAALGATIFCRIESPHEERLKEIKDIRALEINDTINYLADLFWYWQGQDYKHDQFTSKVYNKIRSYEHYVIESVRDVKYDGEYGTWEYDWTFSKSLLFTVSTMSTIGYGQTTPKTEIGMLFVILYAIIGIPLLLLFLANIGDVMATSFKITYSRVWCRPCRSARKKSEYRKGGDESIPVPRPRRRVAQDVIGSEEYMPSSEVNVPIILNLVIIALYVCIGALIFSYWENWDMVVAAYFTFVTLSTTGYGDYVPGRSFMSYGNSLNATGRMIFTCFYCAFGMALVSMSVSLMQEQIRSKIKWVAREVGLTKSHEHDSTGLNT